MSLLGKEEESVLGTIPKEEVLRLEKLGFKQEKRTEAFSCQIISKCGRVTVDEMSNITYLAENYGNKRIWMNGDSSILVEGIPYQNVEAVKTYCEEHELHIGGLGNYIRPIRTCQGKICNNEVIDSYALADKINDLFFKRLAEKELQAPFSITVSGCPEQCSTPSVCDLGIVGVRIPKYEESKCRGCKNCAIEKVCPTKAAKMTEDRIKIDLTSCNKCGLCVSRCPFEAFSEGIVAYRLLLGGRHGKEVAKTTSLRRLFTTEEALLSAIDRLVLFYEEEAKEGEYFGELIDRVGMREVERRIFN